MNLLVRTIIASEMMKLYVKRAEQGLDIIPEGYGYVFSDKEKRDMEIREERLKRGRNRRRYVKR